MKPGLLLCISLALLLTISLNGQSISDTLPTPAVNGVAFIEPYNSKQAIFPANPYKKVTFGMEMGTTFGVSSGNGNLFGVYAAPHISYKVSPKFNVNFGVRINNSNYINYINPCGFENTARFDNNITQTFIYAEGQYQVNNRLMLNAKGYKEVYRFDEPQLNPRALDLDGGGVAFGFQYKVTENFHFGAEVGFNKGTTPYNPYSISSFGQPGFNSYGINPSNGFDPW